MAVLEVLEDWAEETWDDDADGSRSYRAGYKVITDDPAEPASNVKNAIGIPARLSVHDEDASAFVTKRSAKRVGETRLLWEVIVTWENLANEPAENPLDDPVLIRWTSQLYTRPIVKDNNEEAIVNSAGDFFDPPPEKTYVLWTANIQFNVADRPAGLRTYAGAVNNGAITIDGDAIAAERARVVGLDITEFQSRNDIAFKTVTLAVECLDDADPDGYDLSLLDQGYRYKDGTELKDILIEDENGSEQRPSAPVLLDGNGEKLDDPSPSTAVFLNFSISKLADLTAFPGIT